MFNKNKVMRIEGVWSGSDRLSLGVMMANGEDVLGKYHQTTLGFLVLEINLIVYTE